MDVYHRFLLTFTSSPVVFPAYSLNFFGRKGDQLIDDCYGREEITDKSNKHAGDYLQANRLRDRLNLKSAEVLTDSSPESVLGAVNSFVALEKSGLLIRQKDKWFLDVPKIAGKHKLSEALNSISFYPERGKSELERLLQYQTRVPVEITRETRYSVNNPLGGQNLGPLFVLATLWDNNYGNADFTFATSESALTKYVLFRMLIRMGLAGNLGMGEVFIYNKVKPESGFEEWDISKLAADPYEADMLRYTLISSHSLNKQVVNLDKRLLQGGRNFVYLVGNLGKIFGHMHETYPPAADNGYLTEMKSFKFNKTLSNLEKRARLLSRRINVLRDQGTLNESKQDLYAEYLSIVHMLSPILPGITNNISAGEGK